MKKGIVLVAFGKRGYGFAAYNLALSIKHFNPKIKIALIHDDIALRQVPDHRFFDKLIKIQPKDYMSVKESKHGPHQFIDPAKLKTHIYNYLPFTENLYLDVDALALQDLQPLMDHLSDQEKFYITDVRGLGGKDDAITYSVWAKNEDIWKFFKLGKYSMLPAIQSSYCFIRKGTEARKFFKKVESNFKKGFPLGSLQMKWGGTVPDELIFSGTLAQMEIDADAKVKPIFFGNHHSSKTNTQIAQAYYLLSIYGNGDVRGRTLTKLKYIEWYDNLMFKKYCPPLKIQHHFKTYFIMKDKHANTMVQ